MKHLHSVMVLSTALSAIDAYAGSQNVLSHMEISQAVQEDWEEEEILPSITVKDSLQVDPKNQILEKKVKEKLSTGMFAHRYTDVQVQVSNGIATLTGTVKSTSAKLDIEKRAKEVTGIKSVINKINVIPVRK